MSNSKQLSSPFSTGGGGFHFEAHVQASFVALMLTDGHAPCLPCWPIVKIKLQGKIDGFDTDDLVVFVKNPSNQEQRKLLGQVKHSMTITKGNAQFGEVIQAAWSDFKNPSVFTKGKDIIALITGPLSKIDAKNVKFLLDQARYTNNADEFFRNVKQAKFSPPKSQEKLDVIRFHLKTVNGGNEVTKNELYDFLKHFHLLGYDLGGEHGVVLSLLHSHISQFQQQNQQWIWPRIVDIVQTWNQNAGIITRDQLPEDLLEAFKQKAVVDIPEDLKVVHEKPEIDWTQHPDGTFLVLAALVGAWNEKNQSERDVIAQFLGITYKEWLNKAREILHSPGSPLSLKNGIWKVANRDGLLSQLGSRIFDHNLDAFKALAISQLKEPDPAFELPPEKRYAASVHGKVLASSQELRQGIAERLAILGTMPDACSHCSQGKVEETCLLALREILSDADWVLWGSLGSVLPALAEAAPDEFLGAVEKALQLTPCPFDKLFAQEGKGITGRNYLTGLLWALEVLAWEEQHLVRVCVVLGELASHDPGGQWANRPSNSLVTILLPWLPQTLASVDKRKVAVKTLLNECPEIAWNLIIQLLPDQHQTSFSSHKPRWRKTIPDNWENNITREEYLEQVSFYAELAVATAGHDSDRLSVLIDRFDNLLQPAFDQLIEVLTSQHVLALPEKEQQLLWEHLTKFTNKHRRFSDERWALKEDLVTKIEQVAERLVPNDPFNLYQHLFIEDDSELYDEDGDWNEQASKLDVRRDKAISEVFQQGGVESVVQFAESVTSSYRVGYALGIIDDDMIEQIFLPQFLDTPNNKYNALIRGFIWRRRRVKSWEWCDNLDKSDWTPAQIGQFLAYLPFTKKVWDHVSIWLQKHEGEYWTRTDANAYQSDSDLAVAIEKLIEYHRPGAAIQCLYVEYSNGKIPDTDQCVRALIAALSSREPPYAMDKYYIVNLIKLLQKNPSVNQEDLFRIEWEYLPLLNGRTKKFTPQILELRLANNSEFFCNVIQKFYRSKQKEQASRGTTEEEAEIAINVWRLLSNWKTPPGTRQDRTFSEECFTKWLQRVKVLCTESGHLEVALSHIGQALIHAPADPEGLWVHRAIATALNDRANDELRRGFCTGKYNSRGAHWIDPTGKPERELAEQFRSKAEEIENEGFHRFANALRDLAEGYDQEAERIIDEHKQENE